MANLPEGNAEFPEGIYQIETTDPVLGGVPNETTKAGVANIAAMQLAKRTRWLKARVDQLLAAVSAASTGVAGIVRLSSATNSNSETLAATPAAVRAVMDVATARVPAGRTISAGGLAIGGGDLSANRTITVPAATQAEAEAGTANDRAMTPLRVAQAITRSLEGTASLAEAGWVRLPGGLLMQWGIGHPSGGAGFSTSTFPVAFSALPFSIVLGERSNMTANEHVCIVSVVQDRLTETQCSIRMMTRGGAPGQDSDTFFWLAIGV